MKNFSIIQVRMDSSRFPSKAIASILGKPLLWHVIERSKKIGIPIIVATTNRIIDDPIVKIAHDCNVKIFRGSYKDVLDRYYNAAKEFSVEHIFRISADTPLIDPKLCAKMVTVLEKEKIDYVRFGYNTVGIGMEGFTFSVLEKAFLNAKTNEEREQMTMYIKNPKNNFKKMVIDTDYNLGKSEWTVEIPDDLEFVKNIFSEFQGKEIFYTDDILDLLKRKPHLAKKDK